MAQAVALAKLFTVAEVGWALGHAAVNTRFAKADLGSTLDHRARAERGRCIRPVSSAARPRAPSAGPPFFGRSDPQGQPETGPFLLALDTHQPSAAFVELTFAV
ncbi:MAG: hypothetical protein ACRDRP_22670 [Pseudonocardiaceae bacterium]